MYSKVIDPKKDGKVQFDNKGSALRLGNYLEKELDSEKNPDGKLFFNASGDFSKEEMVEMIDSNVKGLKADDDKFYSLVVSPSALELEHIGNDPVKLRGFAITCMENYAQNFQLKDKQGVIKHITEKDLVWFANIEHQRTYKGDDKEVLSGARQQGDKKEGLQTHIHITVSARDASMKMTLNPQTSNKERFSKLKWAEQNQQSFNHQFGFEQGKKVSFQNQQKQAWNKIMAVETQLGRYQQKYGLSDEDTHNIRRIAIEKEHSFDFRQRLKALGKELKQGIGTESFATSSSISANQWQYLQEAKLDENHTKSQQQPQMEQMEAHQNIATSIEVSVSIQKGYHFFQGIDDISPDEIQDLEAPSTRTPNKMQRIVQKRRLQQQQQNTQQDMNL